MISRSVFLPFCILIICFSCKIGDINTPGIDITGLSFHEDSMSLLIGESVDVDVIIEPIDVENPALFWVSSNPSVVSITNNGIITGNMLGESEITVQSGDGSFKDSCIITVIVEGSLDHSFSFNGYDSQASTAGGNSNDHGKSVIIDGSGRIVITGFSFNGSDNDMVIWRYNPDGTLDSTFNGLGYVVNHNAAGGDGHDQGYSIAIDSNGKILVAGYSERVRYNDVDMVIWRYNSDGTLDTSFNSTGIVVSHNPTGLNNGSYDYCFGIAIDNLGKIYSAGKSSTGTDSDMTIWSYNNDGTPNTSFNSVGFALYDDTGTDNDDEAKCIRIDPDGKIVITGFYDNELDDDDMAIWRYNSNGTLDTTFNSTGFVTHHNAAGGEGRDTGQSLAIDDNGDIFVAGGSATTLGTEGDMVVWKYKSNGSLDTSFNSTGIAVFTDNPSASDFARGISLDSKNRIYITGSIRTYIGAKTDMITWRYLSNGTIDTSFNSIGYVKHNNAGGGNSYDYGSSVAIDEKGRVIISGQSYGSGTSYDMAVWRYR